MAMAEHCRMRSYNIFKVFYMVKVEVATQNRIIFICLKNSSDLVDGHLLSTKKC
jgi:hypothetical protein